MEHGDRKFVDLPMIYLLKMVILTIVMWFTHGKMVDLSSSLRLHIDQRRKVHRWTCWHLRHEFLICVHCVQEWRGGGPGSNLLALNTTKEVNPSHGISRLSGTGHWNLFMQPSKVSNTFIFTAQRLKPSRIFSWKALGTSEMQFTQTPHWFQSLSEASRSLHDSTRFLRTFQLDQLGAKIPSQIHLSQEKYPYPIPFYWLLHSYV